MVAGHLLQRCESFEREGDEDTGSHPGSTVVVVSMPRQFGMISNAMKAVGISDGSFGVCTIPGRRAADDAILMAGPQLQRKL